MRRAAAALFAALVLAAPARAERLIASLSSHRVQITSIFNGVELVRSGPSSPMPIRCRETMPTTSSPP